MPFPNPYPKICIPQDLLYHCSVFAQSSYHELTYTVVIYWLFVTVFFHQKIQLMRMGNYTFHSLSYQERLQQYMVLSHFYNQDKRMRRLWRQGSVREIILLRFVHSPSIQSACQGPIFWDIVFWASMLLKGAYSKKYSQIASCKLQIR